MKSRAYGLHQRARIIKKRKNIVENIWQVGDLGIPHPYLLEPGRMAKHNLNCGCKMCHPWKQVGNGKGRYKEREEALINEAKREIKEQVL